tara:strand:+ start:7597 stop:8517 length:921 start_codon:yes stop_codon:yes gene_type:complete
MTSGSAIEDSENEATNILDTINTSALSDEQLESLINAYIANTQEREKLLQELRENAIEKYGITDDEAEDNQIQLNYINMLESKLTLDKLQIKKLNDMGNVKEKKLKITNYYKKYYNAWRKIAFQIFIAVVINCILVLSFNYIFKQFGGEQLWVQILLFVPAISISISIIVIYLNSVDYFRRDDNVFDEYDYGNNLIKPTDENRQMPTPNASDFTLLDGDDSIPEPNLPSSNNIIVMNPTLLTELAKTDPTGFVLSCRNGYTFDENQFRCIPDSEAESQADSNTNGFRNIEGFKGFKSSNYSNIGIC